VATRWIYLPAYAWIFRPFADLAFETATRAWLIDNMALTLLCIGLLCSARPWRGDGLLNRWRVAWIVFMGLTFQPVLDNMWHGNISALIFACFALSYWLLRRDRSFVAGLVLGVIVMLKFYPGLFLLYFAWRRNWSLIAGIVVSCAAILALSLLTAGLPGNLAYFQMVLSELRGGGIPAFNNQSISGFLLHAFTRGDVNAWADVSVPVLLTIARLALILATVGAAVWALRRRPERTANPTLAQDFDLAVVIAVMLLTSPITWYHYYVWLLFPLVVLLDAFLLMAAGTPRRLVWLAVGYGLVAVQGISMIRPFAAQAIQDVWGLRVLLSLSFFGAVILTTLLLRLRAEVR
jgi:alpha-1,2-mannosyltransferase